MPKKKIPKIKEPLTVEDIIAEEEQLVAAGLMKLPRDKKNNDFFGFPAPEVSLENIRAVLRSERDEN